MKTRAAGRAAIRERKFGHGTVGLMRQTHGQRVTKDIKAEMLAFTMMEGFGSVPIVGNNTTLLGIVSACELLASLRTGKTVTEVTGGDIMSTNPVR